MSFLTATVVLLLTYSSVQTIAMMGGRYDISALRMWWLAALVEVLILSVVGAGGWV